MLRSLIVNAWRTTSCASNLKATPLRTSFVRPLQNAYFSSLGKNYKHLPIRVNTSLLQPAFPMQSLMLQTSRDLTKFSLNKGKRKSVKAVIKRFRRLDWGGWIRTHTGRQKKLFKKSSALKRRLRQHIFTNSTQSWLLDKMVGNFWRRPKNWIDDPYAPYNKRDEFFATKSKPFKV